MIPQIRFLHPDAPFGWLSNYFEYRFFIRTSSQVQIYRTVEHYYQAAKFVNHRPDLVARVLTSRSPDGAKGLAHTHWREWRPDWDEAKVAVMRRGITAKFTGSGFLLQQLAATGDAILIEDSPTDPFWGIGPDGEGRNMLGTLLMELRATTCERVL